MRARRGNGMIRVITIYLSFIVGLVAGTQFIGIVAAQQTQADPAFLMKVIGGLQQQRNQALDFQAGAEAREAVLREEISKLKTRVEELEKKLVEAPK
jgi:cell division protein FtsB